mgnify:CR=1 FL=1
MLRRPAKYRGLRRFAYCSRVPQSREASKFTGRRCIEIRAGHLEKAQKVQKCAQKSYYEAQNAHSHHKSACVATYSGYFTSVASEIVLVGPKEAKGRKFKKCAHNFHYEAQIVKATANWHSGVAIVDEKWLNGKIAVV